MGGPPPVSPRSIGSPRTKYPTHMWELHPFDTKNDPHSKPMELGMIKSKSFKDLKKPSHGSVERPVAGSKGGAGKKSHGSPRASPHSPNEGKLVHNLSICSLSNWYKDHPPKPVERKKMASTLKK